MRPALHESFRMKSFLMENIVQDVTGVVEYAVMEYEEEDID